MPRLEDLDISDDEPSDFSSVTQAFLDKIEEMRCCGSYEWADDTLTGIYDSVIVMKRYTEGQRRAVENIWYARTDEDFES